MQKKWHWILFNLFLIFCSFAEARTSIIVSVGQNMYMDPGYQDMLLRQQLRATRNHNRLMRAQIAEMELNRQLRGLPPAYHQPYYFIEEPYRSRRVVYRRPVIRRCLHGICVYH